MASVTAYADASGKDGMPVVCVSGVVAYMRRWIKFEQQWNALLTSEGIKQFHATDFASSQSEFKAWKGDIKRRGVFFKALVEIIRDNVVTSPLSISIETADWVAVNKKYMLSEAYHSPYAICGYAFVGECSRWAAARPKKTRIKFVFEQGDDEQGLRSLCRKDSVEPIFQSKLAAVPCQAADLIAWKSRIACTNSIRLSSRLDKINNPETTRGLIGKLLKEYASLMKGIPTELEPRVFSRDNLVDICKRDGISTRP